ncbi:vWA domain-containing protein [Leisingera sp. S232]|uniref:vWA domain-containing protein n=1 Tax=Leisingera sp. S232 TaxID=3415132 RepID=UPI003C79B831
MKQTRIMAAIALCWTMAPAFVGPTQAQDVPLLIEGKDSLFQRVLVRDSTGQFDTPDGAVGPRVAPLTPLFVYQHADGWLQVGIDEEGNDLFWISETAAVDWNQNIVATFEGSENLERLLFFKEIDPIYDLLELESPGPAAAHYREEAQQAERGEGTSEVVVALGPRKGIDQSQNFYVMPILDFEEEIFDNGAFVNLLQVAVARATAGRITKSPELVSPSSPVSRPITEGSTEMPEDYKVGVAFVVDTTISMEPYIRATRSAMETVYATLEENQLTGAMSVALIGYRDNLTAAPSLEYSARTFLDFDQGATQEGFAVGISQMTEAEASSRNFREDSYAGVEHALSNLNWAGYAGRYIVLVTDAGPRESSDELSITGLSGKGLNTLVRERINGAVAVMHLRTPKGAKDHARAEAAYRELSGFANQAPFYFPIKGGDPAQFRQAAADLGTVIAAQVGLFRQNPDAILTEREEREITDGPISSENRFHGLASAGRTMQLAYLGSQSGEEAPDVFKAFVADRDFDRTGLKPLSIRVLISKAQLSALYDALNIIIEKGEQSIIDPTQFFGQVLGAAADMSRDPDKVARRSDPTLAEAAAIDEYIEDLPYRSRIMNITEEDWLDMSFSEQAAIINQLYDKVARYQEYNEATNLWVDYLGTGARAQNLLYPLPLDDLP